MTDALLAVIILGLCNGAIGQIVTFSSIFEPLRVWVSKVAPRVGEMLGCALCFGAWSAMGLSAVTLAVARDNLNDAEALLVWFPFAMAIHGVGLITGFVYRVLADSVD